MAGGAGKAWVRRGLGLAAVGVALAPEALRSKVVVVYVWMFAYYNCLNALPHVEALAAKHRERDVVVARVHTPEFARERLLGPPFGAHRRGVQDHIRARPGRRRPGGPV